VTKVSVKRANGPTRLPPRELFVLNFHHIRKQYLPRLVFLLASISPLLIEYAYQRKIADHKERPDIAGYRSVHQEGGL
jgi:hypothetical protein